ncbi:hypothetical protein QFC22_002163 [Naganishia vaughanmartiniae]|uniref:Uncharacterized protein n=1 Tax=Naganishia vaughanmartiniae TaxID=1424756 RepID=A0ACC2XDU8_9TREE|nr:hypothetical protein QFC22_002163 [Naganishia vaughanmartiniae]
MDYDRSKEANASVSRYSSICSNDPNGHFYNQRQSAGYRTTESPSGVAKSQRSESVNVSYKRSGSVPNFAFYLVSETSTWTYKILSKLTFRPSVYGKDTSQPEEAKGLLPSAGDNGKPSQVYRIVRSACHFGSASFWGIRNSLSRSVSGMGRSQETADKGSVFLGIGSKRHPREFLPLESSTGSHSASGSLSQVDVASLFAQVDSVEANCNSSTQTARVRKRKSKPKVAAAADLPRALRQRRRELQRLVDVLDPQRGGHECLGEHSKVYEAERHMITLRKAACIFGNYMLPDREDDLTVTTDRLIEDLRYCCSAAALGGLGQPPWEAAYERGRTASMASRPNMDLYSQPSWTQTIPMVGPIISLLDSQPHPNSLELLEREEARLARANRVPE